MTKPRVGVVGYGVIGQRLADGVALQGDMELVGVVDVAPTLSTRALQESGMPHDLYVVEAGQQAAFDAVGIPVSGTLDDLLAKVDIVLDSSPGGVGRKNKELYQASGVKAVFQGGEKNDIVDVFFHGYANYEQGVGKDYLKLTSCNTTGLIRAVDCLDREVGVERVIVTIIRRVADPGDTHRGLVDVAQVEPVPNHQALDLMTIMPHIEATGLLVHVPTTHGHIINVIATTKATSARSARSSCSRRTRASGPSRSPTASTPTRRCSATPATSAAGAPTCTTSPCSTRPSPRAAASSCSRSTSRRRRW